MIFLISLKVKFCLIILCFSKVENFTNSCFCNNKDEVVDCSCDNESIDIFNNNKVLTILDNLLTKDYFRYYKVNIFRQCPFQATANSGKCSSRSCAVNECSQDQLPAGLKSNRSHEKTKYSKEVNEKEKGCVNKHHNSLGDLVHLSEENQEVFDTWTRHDDMQDNFCELDDIESPEAVYYDLVLNPERFTGYTGASAVNVWKLIYDQNCFKTEKVGFGEYTSRESLLCLEKRVFYRLISGFHTSINVDVAANWLIPAKTAFDKPQWGPNLEEFVKRFDPKLTWGEGPNRLKNMVFAYLVEMRALVKVASYLQQETYYTGNAKEDITVKETVIKFLEVIKEYPSQFDENQLFQGDFCKLKEQFKIHFRNISQVMDCVGCDKCRLWGKVQFTGMGTALKILFSGDNTTPKLSTVNVRKSSKVSPLPFQLTRGEIVALFNAFGKLSKSIHEISEFRRMMN